MNSEEVIKIVLTNEPGVSRVFCFLLLCRFSTPFAVASDEWINVDQQDELLEHSAFSPCLRSSFQRWVPV